MQARMVGGLLIKSPGDAERESRMQLPAVLVYLISLLPVNLIVSHCCLPWILPTVTVLFSQQLDQVFARTNAQR